MKIIKLLALFITLPFLSVSQSTFEKIIDTLGSSGASCVRETFDGGYILSGGSILGGNDVSIIKLDSAGNIEWVKMYGGPINEGAGTIIQLPDSGYIVDAGYDDGISIKNWLLRLDVNGDTLWTNSYSMGNGNTFPSQLARGNNGNYGLAGYFNPPVGYGDAYLIITNDSGGVVSSHLYNYNLFSSTGDGITSTTDNGYAITGQYAASSSNADINLFRTDSLGDTLWTRYYDRTTGDVGMAVEQTTDGGFIIAGLTYNNAVLTSNTYLIKTKSNGDTIWTKMYQSMTTSGPYSVQQTTDGGYIVAGLIGIAGGGYPNVYLIKTDSNGDTLWTRQFGVDSLPEYGLFVSQTKDVGYIICGHSSYGTYVIKTDSMGMVSSGTGMPEMNNPFSFQVYPNPSGGKFKVKLNGIPYSNAVIRVYNLFNQPVYECTASKQAEVEINLDNEANGIYLIAVITKEKVFSKKIIVRR